MPSKDIPIHPNRLAQILDTGGIPLRLDAIYANHKGAEKSGIRKKAERALEKLQDILKKVLEPDEAVIYIMPGQAPIGLLQQYTLGWMTYSVTRTMLVVTNRRLLAFHARPKGFRNWDWARRVRSIGFGDLAEARVKGFLSYYLQLHYADGRKEKYWGLRGGDAKKLRLILEAVMPGRAGEATAARGPISLCPNCAVALEPKQETCRQCGQLFATEREMWKRSILFPGGGYFYAGQVWLGVLDAFVETVFVGFLAVFLLMALGVPDFIAGDLDPYMTQAGAALGAGLLAFLLGLEKLITGFHGRHFIHDFYPLAKPPSTTKWLALGLGAYGTIALLVGLAIAANPAPVGKIGSDVDIYRADFGLYTQNREGGDVFTSSAVIPAEPGARYGILIRFRTPRPSVKLKTQFEIPGMEIPKDGAIPEGLKPQEESVESEGGLIARVWGVQAGEPQDQKLHVYLDDKLLRTFTFSVGSARVKPPVQ